MKKIFLTFITLLLSVMTMNAETKKVVIISDIHMGDHRSVEKGWGWFNENRPVLKEFLEDIAAHPEKFSTLVVAGDMFDEWVAPMDVTPFINLKGEESRMESDFFEVLVHDNAEIIDAFRKVKSAGIELVYVPGNHDMTCTAADFSTYLPGLFTQARDAEGLGAYTPQGMDEVVIEHGHRYDFNDMPNPISMEGSILPIGYTISKYASTLKYNAANSEDSALYLKSKAAAPTEDATFWDDLDAELANPEAEVAFNGAMQRLGMNGQITYAEFCDMVKTIKENADNYNDIEEGNVPNNFDDALNHFVYHAAWAVVMIAKPCSSISELINVMFTKVKFPAPYEKEYMYWDILPWLKEKPVIYDGLWPQATWERQQDINKVGVKIAYMAAVLAGGVDPVLDSMAPLEYFDNPKSNKRVVIFGHTHKGLMQKYETEGKGECLYANTGCWIDERWCDGEGVTMLTYVELEKTDGQYKVALKKWGKNDPLASDAIPANGDDPSSIEDNVLSKAKNGKYINNRSIVIRHDGKTYDIEGRTK